MSFRIINVTTNKTEYKRSYEGVIFKNYPASPLSGIELKLSPENASDHKGNWFTIILGKNATGKSRLLSDIAESFCIFSGEFTTRRRASLDINIDFINDGNFTKIILNPGLEKVRVLDGENVFTPSRIISSSTTPFDKFRPSKDIIRERVPPRNEKFEENQIYYYTGLKDSNSRSNFHATILRAIKGIFSNPNEDRSRLGKLENVFNFLGFSPIVQINYGTVTFSSSRHLLEMILSGKSEYEIINELENSSLQQRLAYIFKSDDGSLEVLKDTLLRIEAGNLNGRSRNFRIGIDSSYEEKLFLKRLFLLKDLRLVSFREISLCRKDSKDTLDILEASSGEISIVSGILGIASAIKDNSLILIDEPEASLHPEWQDRYLELLKDTFSGFMGCHFIIATHSPLILADVDSTDSTVLNISHIIDGIASVSNYEDASTDELLATEFGVIDDKNLYLKQEAIKVVNLAARGDLDSPEFKKRFDFLQKIKADMDPNSKLFKLLNELKFAISGAKNGKP